MEIFICQVVLFVAVRQVIEEPFSLVGHRDISHNIMSILAIFGQLATVF